MVSKCSLDFFNYVKVLRESPKRKTSFISTLLCQEALCPLSGHDESYPDIPYGIKLLMNFLGVDTKPGWRIECLYKESLNGS